MIIGLFCTVVIVLGLGGTVFQVLRERWLPPERRHKGPRPPAIDAADVVADAASLNISTAEIERVLVKHFPYYTTLNTYLQQRFLQRTHRFIAAKLFIIKSGEAFREMPVLTAAAAVQLTLGLNGWLLPWFRYIRIYPEAFSSEVEFKLLVGNVSKRTITVSWHHFLHGYAYGTDGSNVALHEMAHALYYQKVEVDKRDAINFCERYHQLMQHCEPAHRFEKSGRYGLYTEYGTTNLQEFWAESVELFFERGVDLRRFYPNVYAAMVKLLKQDPLTKEKVVEKGIGLRLSELASRFHSR